MNSPSADNTLRNLARELAALSPERRALLEQLLRAKGIDVARLPLLPAQRPAAGVPLSFAQQRLWFLDQLQAGNPAYNLVAALRLCGVVDSAALQYGLDVVVRRHESLRTTFVARDGQPVQVVADDLRVVLALEDRRGLPADEQAVLIQSLVVAMAQQPFDLAVGPLLRASLVRIANDEHLFVVTMHHSIADRWSMGIFFQELLASYQAYVLGQREALPSLPIQYADFAIWQRERLSGKALEEQLAYWRTQLANVPAVLELPTDYPRPAIQSTRGARQTLVLPEALVAGLRTLCQQTGVTMFMLLLAALQTLLYRYTYQSDFLIGAPVAGRTRSELEGLIGLFVNTLVLRSDLSGNPTFLELLERVRERVLNGQAHQDLPFEKLVEELRPDRSLSHNPLFQVMFAFQNVPLPEFASADLRVEPLEIDTGTALFDLTLTVVESGKGFTATLEYNLDLFKHSTATRMLEQFQTLLEGVVAQPQCRLHDLRLLNSAEWERLLREWCRTPGAVAVERPLHELFELQAEQTPDALAVVSDDAQAQSITYRALNERANQLAHELRSLGVKPEAAVGLCVERSIAMVVGLLGILKAGGVYVPLDPAYPPERLALIIEDAAIGVVLSQQYLAPKLPAHNAQVLYLDTDWSRVATQRVANPRNVVSAAHSAYLIYTSGSTGRPKGVCVAHGPAVRHLLGIARAFGLYPGERMLQFAALSFDVSIEQILATLFSGATLILRGPELAGAEQFDRDVDALAMTIVNIPPAYWSQWIQARVAVIAPAPNRQLRRVIVGGDAIAPELIRLWRQKANAPVQLLNAYGPTETVVTPMLFDIPASYGDDHSLRSMPIGRPLPGRTAYVLDPYGQPVPIGVPGELHLGGILARGYLNRPDLTAERFIPDAFGEQPGARLYKTGDLVRYLPDGTIAFLGRIDNQIKVRGFRIEPGEIEAVLLQHPVVRETVVLAVEHASGYKELVAYVVTSDAMVAPDSAQNSVELRSFLKAQLPEYMVPSTFVFLAELPRTQSGKLDRRALPAPQQARSVQKQHSVAPRTPNEALLAQIWAEVLGVAQVGIHDNFFMLGGESILSIQIIARANQAGLRLTPRQIFQYQTIAELAAVADTQPVVQIDQTPISGAVVLIPIQRWFFAQHFADQHHWNQAVVLEARTQLDHAMLERAIQHVLIHHDALRLRFVQEGDAWQQMIVSPGDPIAVAQISLVGHTPDAQVALFAQRAAELQASLDLAKGPLLRVALFDYGGQQPARLLFIVHHLAVDGVSWRILLEDLQHAYEQLSQGGTVRLPPKTSSFALWAQRLSEYAQSEDLRAELPYWLAQLQQPITPLPVDGSAPLNLVRDAQSLAVALDAAATDALLRDVAAAYRTQINDLLLTALLQTFADWTGQPALMIDLEGHGREALFDDVDLSRTVGWFTTQFPLRLTLEERSDLGGTLKSVKEQLRRLPQRGLGYGLLRYLNAETAAELSAHAEAQVSFNYLGQFGQARQEQDMLRLLREPSGPTRSPQAQRSHLIEINAYMLDRQLYVEWTYNAAIHQRGTVERLANDFIQALRDLIAHCLSPLAGGYTPADFPLARLDQPTLDRVFARDRAIEDIYPLAPAQQGMLFHSLYAPTSGVYIEQLVCTLCGDLDVAAFRRAWQQIVDRHTILRTSFLWEDLDEPIQVVQRHVDLVLEQYDWSHNSTDEQRQQLDALLRQDRVRGYVFSQAPLMRLFLIQLATDRYQCVWSVHHILMDGWCLPLIWSEVLASYEALRREQPLALEPIRPYRDYIAWLMQQDLAPAERYWRRVLAGVTAPTPLGIGDERKDDQATQHQERRIQLSAETSARLQALARQHGLTLNTLVQGVWALLLSYYSGSSDIVFGVTVSGRPSDLPGFETMIGLFINTLPLRVRLAGDTPLIEWLHTIQLQIAELRQFEYSPLVHVQGWSEVPRGMPLFESIVVFAQYLSNGSSSAQPQFGPSIEIRDIVGIEQTNYPLTLTALPGAALAIDINYNCHRFNGATIERLVTHIERLIDSMLAQPEQQLSWLKDQLAAFDQQQALVQQQERKKTNLQKLKQIERKALRSPLLKGDDSL